MSLQTTAPLDRLHLEESARIAREVARLADDGALDINPVYQRGEVWTTAQRVALVKSWLQGIPVPAIIVNDRTTGAWAAANGASPLDTGRGLYAVVDGKQRVMTAQMWFRGDLPVPASWFPAEDVVETLDTEDGPYVTYTGLTAAAQNHVALSRARLGMHMAHLRSVAEEADLFLLVNGGGTPQTPADMVRAASHATGR